MTSMKYPNLYQMWRNHDLRYKLTYFERHPLWQNLRVEDEERVWLFIEEHYFDRYHKFIQIYPEWESTGLWKKPFPGSDDLGFNISCDHLGLPQDVCKKVQEWQDYFDNYAEPWNKEDPCDYQKLNEWGLAVAKEVKRCAPPDFYVEYNQLCELVIIDDEVIELDVPEFIRNLTGFKSQG